MNFKLLFLFIFIFSCGVKGKPVPPKNTNLPSLNKEYSQKLKKNLEEDEEK